MILKNSYNNNYMKNMLKQNTWIMWMSFLLNGLCTLLPMLLAATQKFQTGHAYGAEYLLMSNIFLFLVAVGGGTITALGMFKYLNSKSEVDFYHSTPVNKNHLFFYRYMTGVTSYLTGLKLTYFASVIIGLVSGLLSVEMILDVFLTLVAVIATFLATYSFVVLGCVVTGSHFMAIATAFGLMFSPVVFTSLIFTLCRNYYDFMGYVSYGTIMTIGRWTNPLYALFGPFNGTSTDIFETILSNIILWIIVTGIAFIAYKKRPSENAGTQVAVRIFRPIIKSLGVLGAAMIGGSVFGYSSAILFYVSSFIIGIIFHIAFEMLFEGDVKAGLNNLKHYLCLYTLLAITFTVIVLDLTGYDTKYTDTEKLQSVTYKGIVLEDRENIEIIQKWVAESIVNLGHIGIEVAEREYDEDGQNIASDFLGTISEEITFNKKNGGSYSRQYIMRVNISEVEVIETSQEYIRGKQGFTLTETELEVITNSEESGAWVNIHGGSMDLKGSEFVTVYKMLEAKQELLTTEYMRKNTPLAQLRCYSDRVSYSHELFIYDIHTDVLEYLDMEARNIVGDVNLLAGTRHEYKFKEIIHGLDLHVDEDYHGAASSAQLPWDNDLLDLIKENMIAIYGESYLYGNYNQYHKEIVFIENVGNIIGYISLETLEDLVNTVEAEVEE